jgi:hypothetical protein
MSLSDICTDSRFLEVDQSTKDSIDSSFKTQLIHFVLKPRLLYASND